MPDAKGDPQLLPQAPWGIISIKAQVSVLSDSVLQKEVMDSLAAGMHSMVGRLFITHSWDAIRIYNVYV